MRLKRNAILLTLGAGLLCAGLGLALRATGASEPARWWMPDEGRVFPAKLDYRDESGVTRTLLTNGPVDTKGHPFFTAIGPNGRACVTCHQPADGMSLAAKTARERWTETNGQDPLFAAFDGANCPDLPQQKKESHSLLLDKGLFRIERSWPPKDLTGKTIEPDFDIEVVRDPTGCNTGNEYGLTAEHPSVSVYRRPRPVSNLKYLTAIGFPYDPKSGMPLSLDPETGKPASGNLMADSRVFTLAEQARDAMHAHLEILGRLDEKQVAEIVNFESHLFTAQQSDAVGGSLDDGGAGGGPATLANSEPGQLGSQGRAVWSEFAAWENIPEDAKLTPEQRAFRLSVARGARVFREKMFLISDSTGINWPIGFGSPVRNSCVFCHNMSQMGNDVAPGQVDLGTTTLPFADPAADLPLFKITCKRKPHPFYGKVIYTYDPGYALTTGKCQDVGRITLQSMRGLAARPPYFANGFAKTLRDIVDYYDRRYNIGYTEQEKQDLVNLMSAL
jgi:hypothetical protein